jgi:predicted Zn-dependent protease
MTIFAFQSQRNLTLTMAHEFGHALGLDHTEKAESLMYAAFTASQQGITDADIAAFRRQCPE